MIQLPARARAPGPSVQNSGIIPICFELMLVRRPEEQTLICVARRSLDAGTTERLRLLLQEPLDWDYLLALASHHGLLPLLHQHVNSADPSAVPGPTMLRLERDNEANTKTSLFLTGELLKVLEFLEKDGIQPIPFKGPTLALRAYGDVGLRQCGDLDILVHRKDVPRLREILITRGFKPKPELTIGQEAALLRFDCAYNFDNERGVVWDVHWAFVERHSAYLIDLDPLWPRREPLTIGGKELLTLSTEDLLLILCLHGFTHLWERLGWICDVASLIDQQEKIDWRLVMENANKLGLRRILLLGLVLASELLDASLPAEMRQAADGDAVVKRLAHQVEEQLFREHRAPPGLFEGAILDLKMRERKRDWLRSGVRLILTPRSSDWMSLSLPESLFFLYYLLRPVRLARKYGLQLLWGSKDRRTPTGGNGLSNS